ncbi:hypothetical protein HYR54_12415 [Candidatus Acetothermia bacterium]|nr:hypothetical protein [Candidatus Acetothermia bacterium]
MNLSKMRHWKLIGLAALMIVVLVPLLVSLKGTSQPPITQSPSQPTTSQNPQEGESAPPNFDTSADEEDGDTYVTNEIELADAEDEDAQDQTEQTYAFALDQQTMPMMAQATPEQKKLAQQNHLLLLIDRLGLSKDQLTQLKNITGGLIKSRDESRAAMEKNQKDVNDFLLKFQGSEDDLKKGLEPLRKAGQDLKKAHQEKVAAAEKALKQNLNWEQGEKLMKAVAGRHRVMIMRHGMPGMMQHGGPGFFGQQGQQMRKGQHNQGNQPPSMGQMMKGQQHQGNQPPQPPMMRGQQPMNPMQVRQNQGPKIGPLGHFLMLHLDTLDAALAAKLAALGS